MKYTQEVSDIYNLKESKLRLPDTEIDYISFGRGERPLVMIQGLNTRGIKGAGLGLALAYRIFAKDFKVYLFDRRPDVWDEITVRDFAKDLAMALDALKITNADIFGVSEGGMIAQYLAIDRPDLVRKLVLAVTLSKTNETTAEVINTWVKMTEQDDMKALVKDMAEKMYSEKYLRRYRPLLPLLTLLQKPKDKARFITLAKSCLTCSAYNELEKIKCPVLVLGAEEDKIVGAQSSLEIAEKLGCEIYMYEGLGHAAYEEAKDFNTKVYNFLIK